MPSVEPEPIPQELTDRDQWLLWDSSHDTPRQPHWKGDFRISWSDPDDWHSFPEAVAAAQQRGSWGIGYVMALDNDDHARGLYGCLDLDGCLASRDSPKDWLPSLDVFVEDGAYIERSPSGDGLHIPLVGQDAPDWWRDSHFSEDEHEGVEYLTNKFVTFTGDQLGDQHDGVSDVEPTTFLYHAYEQLNGEAPRDPDVDPAESGRQDSFTESQVEEALSHVDSNCAYPEWRDVAFAVHDWDSGATGKALVEQWSRGPGWDDESQELIDKIWDGADSPSGSKITVATLAHKAMGNGWEPSFSSEYEGTPTAKELVARYNDEFESAADVPDIFDRATDGGDTVAGPASGDTDRPVPPDEPVALGDDGQDEDPAPAGDVDGWEAIYQAYVAAEDADERLPARYEATEQLTTESHWRTLVENDQLWRYDAGAGIYRPDGEAKARERLVNQLKEQYKAHEQSEICDQIRGRSLIREAEFGGPDGYIATENCVLEIGRDRITQHEHSPAYEFVGRCQTPYDPDADCPRFKSFLRESVEQEAEVETLQEYAGYALMHWRLPHHKALFLVGPTASGKSTFLDAIRAMLGEDATASLTPQQMTSERFGGAELYGKMANIRNDIPASMIEDTGQFKEITAGDPIKAEEKYQDPFMFEPTAKHMFSANELPDAQTDDEAFYRRILLLAFPQTVPRGERDPKLDAKLATELPGILNWCLDGLQRLLRQGRFTMDRTPAETQRTWEKWGNSVSRFEQACLADGNESIPKSEIHQAYIAFCEDEGIPTETQHKMTRELKLEGYQDGQARVNGRKTRVFMNIEWTGRGQQYLDSDDGDRGGLGDGASHVDDY